MLPGIANFLLRHLPDTGPDAAAIVQRCHAQGLFMRDAARRGASLGPRVIRIAVKDAATNARMLRLIRTAAA